MKYQGFIWGGLYVEDVERAILFYRDVLGLPLLRRGESSATFAFPNGALFGLFSGGIASSTAKTPEQQSLELGFRVNDLDAASEELEAKGVQFVAIPEFQSIGTAVGAGLALTAGADAPLAVAHPASARALAQPSAVRCSERM